MATEEYDIIIIGTGAGGGTLAHHLAPSGKRILLLERGGYLPREKQNWLSEEVFLKGRYTAKEPWIDDEGNPFHPGIHYYVGGNTKLYGAALLRMREQDFGEIAHKEGISPAWPISYSDLAPYYTLAESLYHVHGQRGSDPTEATETMPYRYPPLQHEPVIQTLFDRLKQAGYHPFPLPVGLILDESNREKSPCIRCNTCDGFPCLVDGKADAQVVCVDPTIKNYPNVSLLTNAYVERLETSASGKQVSEVIVKRFSKTEVYKGKIVVVSCGAINSAALLLRSANHHHPKGLANSSDVVGRFYMCHNNSALLAVSKEINSTAFQKTIGINDFYFGSEDWNFPLGHIQMLGKSDKKMLKADAPFFTPPIVLDKLAKHSIDFWMTTEDLPDPSNRVISMPDGNVQLLYTPNNRESHAHLAKKLKQMLKEAGYSNLYLSKVIPLAGTAHQNGTVRFGKDPKTSALDIYCKAHDLDNLYVVDGSFFVSSSSVNPSLTIIANALRVGDHLLERIG
jgi:choline dehydrogenase-like flavoprotein